MTPIKYAIAINKNGHEEYMQEMNSDDCFTDDIGCALIYEKWTDVPKLQSADEYIVEVETDEEGGLSAGTKWTRPMTPEQERAEARKAINEAILEVGERSNELFSATTWLSIHAPEWLINSLDREEQLKRQLDDMTESRDYFQCEMNSHFELWSKAVGENIVLQSKVAEQDKEILRLQGELSEQQEISHNFHRMSNEYFQEIQQWKDRADRAETMLEDITHGSQT
jgi:hypothetical protein